MSQEYEYEFVRIAKGTKDEEYREVVRDHAREGWRLVQVLAPGAGGIWASANFVEVILERRLTE